MIGSVSGAFIAVPCPMRLDDEGLLMVMMVEVQKGGEYWSNVWRQRVIEGDGAGDVETNNTSLP